MYCDIECPRCNEEITEVESEDLPANSCDDGEIECPHCENQITVGWVAEVELR